MYVGHAADFAHGTGSLKYYGALFKKLQLHYIHAGAVEANSDRESFWQSPGICACCGIPKEGLATCAHLGHLATIRCPAPR